MNHVAIGVMIIGAVIAIVPTCLPFFGYNEFLGITLRYPIFLTIGLPLMLIGRTLYTDDLY
jgi:hypothetical protein